MTDLIAPGADCPVCHGSFIEEAYGGHGSVIELPCSACSPPSEHQYEHGDASRPVGGLEVGLATASGPTPNDGPGLSKPPNPGEQE